MDLLITIAGTIVEHAWVPISRQFRYLICYKSNIEKLESKFNQLDDLRKDVQVKVDAARRERLEEVDCVVQSWLGDVDKMEGEVTKINDQATAVISKNCFPDIKLHYKLGRDADILKETIGELITNGKFDGVAHNPPPPAATGSLLFNEHYMTFDSRKFKEKEILEALKDEAVGLIGLWGMGGGGKTTLVKQVADQALKQSLFSEVALVTVSQNIDLRNIQTVIAEQLRLDLKEHSVQVRADKLRQRLSVTENKVLVIIDDLWETLNLSDVGVRLPHMAATCKVVITTRNRDVCETMSCKKIVELKTLSDEESWSLFKSRAGDAVESSPTLRELARKVAGECGRLPLALVVLGTALAHKSPETWKTVLTQLKRSKEVDLPGVNKKLFKSIELSFNFLESEAAKSCFLHCCLYPEDKNIPKEELMPMMAGGGLLADFETLNAAQSRVNLLLDHLKARCLLLPSPEEGCVIMHDVVRDVAIRISAKDHMFDVRAGQGLKEWPRSEMQNCRRLSLMHNDIDDLPPDPMRYPKLETLILRRNRRLSSIPEMFFQHMGSLRVLDLSNTSIESLPKSLSCLTNLRVLNLRRCKALKDISHINDQLNKLEMLILEDCRVSIAPEGVEWAQNVKVLHLGNDCLDDYFSKEFRRFRRLEQLFINKFAGSFGELVSLSHLTHLCIRKPVALDDPLSHEPMSPGSWPDRLVQFSLSFIQHQLIPLRWHSCSDRRSLLVMGNKPLAVWVKTLLEKSRQLALVEFQETELNSIPSLSLSSLQYLKVDNWPNLTKLLGDELLLHEQISFNQLEAMIILDCPRLTSLMPSSLCQKLDFLRASNCPMMRELFPCDHKAHDKTELNGLPNLNFLEIKNCGVRYVFSFEMETAAMADPFPRLEGIHIKKCQEMREMICPHTSLHAPCFFQGLISLEIKSCPRLTHLFSYKQAISMQHLDNLRINDCAALEAVVISTENEQEASASTSTHVVDHESSYNTLFPRLKYLKLVNLPQLTAFPHPTAPPMEWLELKECMISGCPKLEPWAEQVRSLMERENKVVKARRLLESSDSEPDQ